ncbi:hypothetical protein RUND412_004038 [Rhizina undulata]
MPRAQIAGREIRRRSRNGCWNCKARKVKCGEEKPRCSNCERLDEDCDYKIRLSWGGRPLKKKQLENGGNGQDPNTDDQSQFIPGAGHFSLNSHYAAPQTFVQTNHSNGTTRKPPIPRAGSGKKTTMSNYQTVFSVSKPPVAPPPALHTSTAAPVDPQLTAIAPPQQRSPQTPIATQHQQRSNQYGWQPGLTPTTSTSSSASTYDHEDVFRGEQQQSYYSPFTPVSMSFDSGITSPTNNYAGVVHSPPAAPSIVTSPHTPYSQVHPQHQPQKNFHPPPPINTSPSKRLRTSMSPTQPPPNSPYMYEGMHTTNLATSLPPHSTSLGTALDYMTTPITTAPMAHMSELHAVMDHHTAVNAIGMGARRVSVENLLAPPLPTSLPENYGYVDRYSQEIDEYKREPDSPASSNMHFGVDNGEPDLDNDDDVEEIQRDVVDDYTVGSHHHHHHHHHIFGTGMAHMSSMASFYQPPTYPVPITIPRKLDPLPELLLASRKNMMYFHHYLNYTARLLVPHDCSENPFKSVLPQMAVETDHLMNLLLAYSASHRARLLGHPEPTERISRFIDETVRSLQVSLNHPDKGKSDATLATAIMLSSYQIISPAPFDLPGLTWQTHLSAARKIIMARGGASGMHSRDKVSYFLVRWFAYLDLLGSLSGRDNDEPLFSGKYWTNDDGDESEEYSVDCFFGFTSRGVSILAKIGELAKRCERERRSQMEQSEKLMRMNEHDIQAQYDSWKPTPEVQREAMTLEGGLEEARTRAIGQCYHNHNHNGFANFRHSEGSDSELMATNDAFHWAALVHLYRRVLNHPTRHQRVQNAVAQIVRAMHKVRFGGTAENCLLFPLFSAGCEAIGENHREYTLKRLMEVEKSGLTQVRKARLLMQRVWEEGRPWWEMADGEFIG